MTPQRPVLPTVPLDLPHVNLAEGQEQYLTLPAMISNHTEGCVTTRWKLTWRERLKILFSGNLWHQQLAFHKPVQPIKILADEPDVTECL